MITSVSHITLAADDPERAATDYQFLLGQTAQRLTDSGRPMFRFQLRNIAFEIVVAAGQKAGLQRLAFAVDDMAATTRRFSRRGIGCEPVLTEQWTDETGGSLVRTITQLAPTSTHGVPISLVEEMLQSARPAITPSRPGSIGIDHVVIVSGNPERSVALYGGRLGLDFALDRTAPEWGTRLLFFLCGGVRIEISHSLAKGISDDPDLLSGLAWLVDDATLARRRLSGSGVQTSEVRKGRRPGSQVLTVRSHTCGVPTLFLSETPRAESVL